MAREPPHGPSHPWDWEELLRTSRAEAGRVLGRTADAEDAAQEAMVRAWRLRRRLRDPGAQGAWVRTITRREAQRTAQAAARRQEMAADPAEEHDWGAADPPAEDSLQARVDIARAIRKLSPGDRLLLRLRYAEDLTQPRIAQLTGTPEGTTKVRLHRLRQRLRAELEPP